MNNDIDVVIAYVDSSDINWHKQCLEYCTSIDEKRFRSFDNLNYLMRLIDKNLPFIRNVYLVVSSMSQVPTFINKDTVKIVLHEDIIPKKYLPTFNILEIELFFNRIPGISDRFIYFNDDMFPLKPLKEDMFFNRNMPCLKMKYLSHPQTRFGFFCLNNKHLIEKDLNKKLDNEYGYWIPFHSALPLFKSDYDYFWEKYPDELYNSLSKFREDKNYTQYLFSMYRYYTNRYLPTFLDFEYGQFNTLTLDSIMRIIKNKECSIFCINDDGLQDGEFNNTKKMINESFEFIVPNICKYEV